MANALKQWELENAVQLTDSHRDALYAYDPVANKAETDARPWREDPHYFKTVRISAVALLKMVMHARSGGSLEIMGLMQGYVSSTSFVVTDAFRLPVEGTETRVNAGADADEYSANFLERARESGQLENAVGWYHSHPGYGCWLSGIDVGTQMLHQGFQDPFVAVVIDPDRTISAGKVEIGAFRTFPENYKPSGAAAGDGAGGGEAETDEEGFQTIPLAKIEDFGAHAARYYSLDVTHFKSSLDAKLLEALWNKYWVSTLAASPLFANRDYATKQMADLALKIRQADQSGQARWRSSAGANAGPTMGAGGPGPGGKAKNAAHDQMEKIVRAGNKIEAEEESGLLAVEIKERLFSGVGATAGTG